MAPANSHHHRHSLSSSSSSSSSVLDALYCEEQEEQWEELEGEGEEMGKVKHRSQSLLPILNLENDLFWEDEELLSLLSKEQQMIVQIPDSSSFSLARREAVEWMLMVNSYYGFSTLTAILSVNYLHRFLCKSPHLLQQNKPWMMQLAAATCLSLAAKFEETDVPLLLDLQVEGTKYVFEAKTIQKMELLVLSTLDWRMNPVTPISFLDHITRRLGLKNHLHREFLRRCEQLLLSIVAESRFVAYLPSVMATATMMQVIDLIEPSNPLDYQNQLLRVLNINVEKVKKCYEMIAMSKKSSAHTLMNPPSSAGTKRERDRTLGSPKGVIDAYYFSSDSSNDSWALTGCGLSTSPSVSSSPDQRALKKKKRVHEQCTALGSSFVDANGVSLISTISYIAICLMRHFVLQDLVAFFLIFHSHLWKRY